MIRILLFLIVVFALGLGFAWLADRPGDMVITFNGYQYQVSLTVAAVAATALVVAVMITWWLLKSIWYSPYTISRYFRVRSRDRGYQALSTGMIAAGAGDAALARKMNKQAAKLIRSETEPLIGLLDAQASLLEGDHASAREKFERMLDDPEMRLLGLRGLYLEAERLGNRAAAQHYAGRAADIAPQLAWAADATMEEKTARGDWDGALKLVEAQKSARQIERAAADRRRAVLLTAKAQDIIDTDLNAARAAAVEANRLCPDFTPAAVIAAKALFRHDDVRKGSKILETAWKTEPHPEIAQLYVHARHGDAVLDRLARAKKLQSLKQNHVESSLAVARASLDAHEFAAAKEAAEAAMRMQPREGVFLLLADIEEAQTGDQGRVRQYLSKAVRAPRDPAWVADGYVSEHWMPFSPITGKLDAFEWRAPMERLAQVIELDEPEPEKKAVPRITVSEDMKKPAEASKPELVPETAAAAVAAAPIAAMPAIEPAPAAAPAEAANAAEPTQPTLAHMPDDPGVDPSEHEKASRRFRLF